MTGLIVAGMHRSGTSLLTRLLSDGGWHSGESLLRSSTEEHFEDESFAGIFRYLVRPGSLASSVWGDEARRAATFQRILGKHQSVTGPHMARIVLDLVQSRKDLELIHLAADARAADAADYAAAIDADRTRLAAELHQERLDNATALQDQHDEMAGELVALRARRSIRLVDSLARRPAWRSGLMPVIRRWSTRRESNR